MSKKLTVSELEERSRINRINILKALNEAGSGHPGGSLSAIDILTVLYNNVMRHDSGNPKWEKRDRFFLSKGHINPALYAILADCGYFDVKELMTLRKFGSILQGHPDMHKTPGVEASAGSLGQGLSVSVGAALGAKLDKQDFRVYCMTGDGELQEGQIWEAAMSAGHYKLDNLCAIVDYNGIQIDGKVEDVLTINPLKEKWEAFNWHVIEADGHDFESIESAFWEADSYKGKPSVIIAKTIKGKGVSYMEDVPSWHGVAPNDQELETALNELTV